MQLKIVSSLEKCFLGESVNDKKEYTAGSCLKNELFHFEICYRAESADYTGYANLTVESPIAEYVRVLRIEPVPVQLAASRPRADSP